MKYFRNDNWTFANIVGINKFNHLVKIEHREMNWAQKLFNFLDVMTIWVNSLVAHYYLNFDILSILEIELVVFDF